MVKAHAATYVPLRVHKLAFSIEMREKVKGGWVDKNVVRIRAGLASETQRYCDAFVIGYEKVVTEQRVAGETGGLGTKVCSGKSSDDHEE
jgi:hypothetical protein